MKYQKCKCGLQFLKVDFILNRIKGYCSKECEQNYQNDSKKNYDVCMKNLETKYKRPNEIRKTHSNTK